MTDQTIPADDLRRFIARYRTATNGQGSILLDELEALLPAPPLPTLADMSPDERRDCQWMQADAEQQGRTVILQPNASVGRALMLDPEANLVYAARDEVTPRPDLPRMEWPGTEKPAPTPALPEGWRLADHKGYGRGIVTNPTPNRDGHVYFVIPDDDPMGYEWVFCTPDDLTYLDY